MNTITALLIDPHARQITTIHLPADDLDAQSDALYTSLGCTYAESILHPAAGHMLLVDEEGIRRKDVPADDYFIMPGVGAAIIGKGLIVARDSAGNLRSVETTPEQISTKVKWLTRQNVCKPGVPTCYQMFSPPVYN